MENNNSSSRSSNSNCNGKSGFGERAKPTNEQEENPNVYCDDNHLNIESEEEEEEEDEEEEEEEEEEDEEEEEEEDEEEEEEEEEREREEAPPRSSSRTPFTNLSKVDADLALARTLQEQERAIMMLSVNVEDSDNGSREVGSYLHDEEDNFGDPYIDTDADDDEDEYDSTDVDDEGDAFDVPAQDDEEDNFGDPYIDTDADDDEDEYDSTDVDDERGEDNSSVLDYDPAVFSSDEDEAGAQQDAEERERGDRLFALAWLNISDRLVVDLENHGDHSQDPWEEVDPDELSHEELLALDEDVGSESRGLSADTVASLPSVNYKAGNSQNGSNDLCVICLLDYEDGDTLTMLSCKHSYHPECINEWLKIRKVCPVCLAEVSTSRHS